MLALVVSKQDQDEALTLGELRRTTPPAQNLDSEERGEARRHSVSSESSDEDPRLGESSRRRQLETGALLMNSDGSVASGDESERDRERRVWEITSGEFMAVELKVIDVVRKQWRKGAIGPRETAQSGSTITDTGSDGTRRRV